MIRFVLLGFASSGVIVTIFRSICLVSFNPKDDVDNYYYGTLLYFGINLLVLISAGISLMVMKYFSIF
jgi:hypothetical protein